MALPDYIGPTGWTARTSGISGASCASGANYLGVAIDNSTNLDGMMLVEIVWQFATAPAQNKNMRLHMLKSFDGTNFEEGAGDGTGSGNVAPLMNTLIRAIVPPNDTAQHRDIFEMPIPPVAFKLLFANVDTGQTVTVSVNVKTRKDAQIVD